MRSLVTERGWFSAFEVYIMNVINYCYLGIASRYLSRAFKYVFEVVEVPSLQNSSRSTLECLVDVLVRRSLH